MNPAVRPIVALTSVRGIAAWMVVLFHFREALPQTLPDMVFRLAGQGYLAVDLFFVLSGFVIALNYANRFQTLRMAEFRRFLVLRMARIYPLHFFMMVLFLLNPLAIILFSTQGTPDERYDPVYYVLSLLLVQNWGFVNGLAWNVPAWSISTEWFAYLLFPVYALGIFRFARGVPSSLALAGLILVLLAAVFSGAGLSNLGSDIEHFGLVRCALGFGVGMLLWRLRSFRPVSRRGEGNAASLAAASCFIAYALLPLPDYATVPLGFALLIWALTDEDSFLSRLFRLPALEYIGIISYSTYLVHFFAKDWVKFILVRPGVPEAVPILAYVCATAAGSVLLYHWVEVPGRRLGRGFAALRGGGLGEGSRMQSNVGSVSVRSAPSLDQIRPLRFDADRG